MWKHRTTRKQTERHPAAIIYSWLKFWADSTENFYQPKLWHTVCTRLEGPLGSFLTISNHNHLPRCLLVWHKCKEFNGLILPWLKSYPGVCYKFLSRLVPLLRCCRQSPCICLYCVVAQCNNKTSVHHPITTCKCFSHIIMSFMSNLVCFKHQNFGSMSLNALVMLWIYDFK
jgi:hypothetical protein